MATNKQFSFLDNRLVIRMRPENQKTNKIDTKDNASLEIMDPIFNMTRTLAKEWFIARNDTTDKAGSMTFDSMCNQDSKD